MVHEQLAVAKAEAREAQARIRQLELEAMDLEIRASLGQAPHTGGYCAAAQGAAAGMGGGYGGAIASSSRGLPAGSMGMSASMSASLSAETVLRSEAAASGSGKMRDLSVLLGLGSEHDNVHAGEEEEGEQGQEYEAAVYGEGLRQHQQPSPVHNSASSSPYGYCLTPPAWAQGEVQSSAAAVAEEELAGGADAGAGYLPEQEQVPLPCAGLDGVAAPSGPGMVTPPISTGFQSQGAAGRQRQRWGRPSFGPGASPREQLWQLQATGSSSAPCSQGGAPPTHLAATVAQAAAGALPAGGDMAGPGSSCYGSAASMQRVSPTASSAASDASFGVYASGAAAYGGQRASSSGGVYSGQGSGSVCQPGSLAICDEGAEEDSSECTSRPFGSGSNRQAAAAAVRVSWVQQQQAAGQGRSGGFRSEGGARSLGRAEGEAVRDLLAGQGAKSFTFGRAL